MPAAMDKLYFGAVWLLGVIIGVQTMASLAGFINVAHFEMLKSKNSVSQSVHPQSLIFEK